MKTRYRRPRGYRGALTKQDRTIAAAVARRMGLSSGTRLLRPYRHNPSPEFCALVGPEYTPEDTEILGRMAWKFCPLTYNVHLNT